MLDATALLTADAPAPVGPYSQAIRVDGFVFCSGQVGLDPATGKLVAGGVAEQTRQVLNNLAAVLAAADLTFGNVVKTMIFLVDINDFAAVNAIYARNAWARTRRRPVRRSPSPRYRSARWSKSKRSPERGRQRMLAGRRQSCCSPRSLRPVRSIRRARRGRKSSRRRGPHVGCVPLPKRRMMLRDADISPLGTVARAARRAREPARRMRLR